MKIQKMLKMFNYALLRLILSTISCIFPLKRIKKNIKNYCKNNALKIYSSKK